MSLVSRVSCCCGFLAIGLLAAVADAQRAAPGAADDYGIPQVRFINEQIREVWEGYQIKPSAPATDGEWCRRVFLDVLGRVPTVEELEQFTSSSDSARRAKLVNRLLSDEAYTEEYARNWTTIWTNILIGRSGGSERNSLTSREGLQKFLRDSFARNKPYDQLVYELVTATGSNTPGSEGFNGAVNFLTMKLDDKAALATGETSKVFLGLQVQCTQCHNHPFNDWKQHKFWEMNAFFRQTRALPRYLTGTRDVRLVELVNQDFAGETNDPKDAEIYYEERNGELRVAYPVFVDGVDDVGRSGRLDDVDRRTTLGKKVVASQYMRKAIVNRMWAHFLGYGFTKPIDDMGPHNRPTHPVLLDYLAAEFEKQSHNLKELIRWITLSDAYGLSSRTNRTNQEVDDPLLGESPKFSRFYLRQLRAEELYESLLVATEAHKTRGSYEEQEKAKAEWLRQFVVAFGNDEGEETTTFNGTIPQALTMFNGDLIKQATSAEKGSFLWRVATSKLKPAEKINHLFQAGMSRKANRSEIEIANNLLAARARDHQGKPNEAITAALQDIWWAVLNSNEFIINH